jgi:hypothetical protein
VEIVVGAVHFDGTNDWLDRGAGLTGAVDGENLIHSLWFKVDDAANDDTLISFFRSVTDEISIFKLANNKLRVLYASSGGQLYKSDSDDLFDSTTNTGWHHLLVALELDVTPVAHIYLDDSPLAVTVATGPLNGDIDFTPPGGTNWGIGATSAGANKMTGDLAEVYMAAEYLDISIEANRRKFISAGGSPIDLGADGSAPTGTAPIVFFSGATDAWHTNKGSGGGFTENGALTDASSRPGAFPVIFTAAFVAAFT